MDWGRYNLVIYKFREVLTSTLTQALFHSKTFQQAQTHNDPVGFLMTVKSMTVKGSWWPCHKTETRMSQNGNQKVTEQKPEYSDDRKLLELRWRAGDDVADGASCQQNFRKLEEKQEEDGYWWRGASTMVYLDGSITWRFEQLSTWNFDRDQTYISFGCVPSLVTKLRTVLEIGRV